MKTLSLRSILTKATALVLTVLTLMGVMLAPKSASALQTIGNLHGYYNQAMTMKVVTKGNIINRALKTGTAKLTFTRERGSYLLLNTNTGKYDGSVKTAYPEYNITVYRLKNGVITDLKTYKWDSYDSSPKEIPLQMGYTWYVVIKYNYWWNTTYHKVMWQFSSNPTWALSKISNVKDISKTKQWTIERV